jgi:hypothetical protein
MGHFAPQKSSEPVWLDESPGEKASIYPGDIRINMSGDAKVLGAPRT